jgi:hypothetical protein
MRKWPSPPDRLRRHVAFAIGGGRTLRVDHPAAREGRSIFQSTVRGANDGGRVLKCGGNSRKIGKRVAKGRWAGMPIVTLTLEERRTCPSDCLEWLRCYGNNMHWAHRITAGAALEERLQAELADLQILHPHGYVVRLHVLGDFYSVTYVDLWRRALALLPALHIFGFTARSPDEPIGAAIVAVVAEHPARFVIRQSGLHAPTGGAVTVPADAPTDHLLCPAQHGQTACCATCALCWQSPRTIAFRRH